MVENLNKEYSYCNSSKKSEACKTENLRLLDSSFGHHPGLTCKILICEKCSGLWKMAEYKSEKAWLRVEESTWGWGRNNNDPHYYFPFVLFTSIEAKKYGYIIQCNTKIKIHSYHGLNCDPEKLVLITELKSGIQFNIRIYECPNCDKIWKITEEYDSHHGTNRLCEILDRKEISQFDKNVINEQNNQIRNIEDSQETSLFLKIKRFWYSIILYFIK